MKRKIVLSCILTFMMLNQSVFAGGLISDVKTDRPFEEYRTVYYVEAVNGEIPDISPDGFEVVKKAEEAFTGGALTEKNVTVLKNTTSGDLYRFIIENKQSVMDITEVSLSDKGLLVRGSLDGPEKLHVMLVKPKEKFSDETFALSEIENDNMQNTVLDVAEVKAADINGEDILLYKFPQNAISGRYGVMITAEKPAKSFYQTVFYMSEADKKQVIKDINDAIPFDETHTKEQLKTLIEKNSVALYLDMTDYNKLSDSAKLEALSYLDSATDYTLAEDIQNAFYKGVTFAAISDGLNVSEILKKNNSYVKLEMYDEYVKLKNVSAVDKKIKEKNTEKEIRDTFNNSVVISMINEADPADIKNIIKNYNEYLGMKDETYKYFMANAGKCIKSLGNKNFDNVSQIDTAIENVKKKNETNNNDTGHKGGGGGAYIPKDPGYTVPSEQKKPQIPEKNENEIKHNLKVPFKDIDNVSWAHTAIEHLYINKILSGKSDDTFAPDDFVKREEFVKLIVNGFGFNTKSKTSFKDVPDDAWYKEFIDIAVGSGVVNGISDEEFGSGKNITREDMAVIIFRAVQASGLKLDIIVDNKAELSDLDEVSDYAKAAVNFMIEKGAINGIDGKFLPKQNATRAQTAQMLYNIIKIR